MNKNKNNKKNKKVTGMKGIFKWIRRGLSVLFMCLFFTVVILGIVYGKKLINLKNEAVALLNEKGEEVFFSNETSIVYDKDGNEILYLSGEQKSYYIEKELIPEIIKETFVISEDRNYYKHSGIDIKGILRAMWVLMKNDGEVKQGGSTITQQLARNIYLSHEVSIERKIKEMFIAHELEKRYDKNTILEYYINNIYFSNGMYGIEAAARGFFNKSINELTMSQQIFLCAIPNNPTLYDPYLNMDKTLERRDRLINQLVEGNIIDYNTGEELKSEEIVLNPGKTPKNNYVDTYVKYCATIELMEYRGFRLRYSFNSKEDEDNYSELYNKYYSECNSLLFSGGYRIYTSIDMEMQNKLQEIIDEKLSTATEKNEEGIYEFQSSSVCIDNLTGMVTAIVGGRTVDNYAGYTINRAYQSHRQPGSCIKPILVYTPAFSMGYNPDTIMRDYKFEGGPKNLPDVYSGAITLRRAVEVSKNTIAWRLLKIITPEKGLRYLKDMGFTQIVNDDYNLAASLGGMTYGTSAKEMAAAYATIENDGVYRQPTCIIKILNNKGEEIIYDTVNEKNIYDENASRMMTDVLKGVLTHGTGKKFQVKNAICAAKTGTTDNSYDKWFVGYSRYYTVSVWTGYDYPKEIPQSVTDSAGDIWSDFMTYLHNDKTRMDFEKYADEVYKVEDETDRTTEKSSQEEETQETENNSESDSYGEQYTEETAEVTDDGLYTEVWE